MPTIQLAPTKATTMNKIGYKKTKRDNSIYKAKFKKRKLEKKMEGEDSY
jgi:hypothetical protein